MSIHATSSLLLTAVLLAGYTGLHYARETPEYTVESTPIEQKATKQNPSIPESTQRSKHGSLHERASTPHKDSAEEIPPDSLEDSARSLKEDDSILEMLMHTGDVTAVPDVKIYIYDLPDEFSRCNGGCDHMGLYGLEVLLPQLLRNSTYVTGQCCSAAAACPAVPQCFDWPPSMPRIC